MKRIISIVICVLIVTYIFSLGMNAFANEGYIVGDTIEFGTYPFEADGTKRPIKWAVLRQDGKKLLLLSASGSSGA